MESVAYCLEIKSMCKAQGKRIFPQHAEGMSDFQAGLCQKVLFPGRVLPGSFSGPHSLPVSNSWRIFWMFVCMQACPKLIHVTTALMPVTVSPFYLHPPLLMIQQTLPPLKNSSCFQFKWQQMRNPIGVQSLPSSRAPQAELAWATCHGVWAVVEMLDICQGHCSCWLPSPSCAIMGLMDGFPQAKGTTDLKEHCTKEPVTAQERLECCGLFPKCQF